jgi:hypothetical protein
MIGVGIGILRKRYIREGITAQMSLASTGDGSGVSTLRLRVSADTTVTLEGDANFYTDAAGTLNESKTWTITAGALRTIYLKAPSANSSSLIFPDRRLVTGIGDTISGGWASAANAAKLTLTPSEFINLLILRIQDGNAKVVGGLPSALNYLFFLGSNRTDWEYEGVLPSGLTFLRINDSAVKFSSSLLLPTGLTYLWLQGNLINWTALDASGNGNITTFNLSNHRDLKMSDAELVTLLTSMINRVGNLPATAEIGDIANPTSTDAAVLQALADLVTVKGCTVTRSA